MKVKMLFTAACLVLMATGAPPSLAQTEVVNFVWCPNEAGSEAEYYELVACTNLANVLGTALASASNLAPVPPFTLPEYPGESFEGAGSLTLPTRTPYFVVARAVDNKDRTGPWSAAYEYDPGPPGGLRCGPIRL